MIPWDKLSSIVIATFVAFVALGQWTTARKKLKLDLYNRRFDIYSRLLDLVTRMHDVGSEKVKDREILISASVKAAREAQFLFTRDPEIAALIDRIRENSIKVSDFYLVVTANIAVFGSRLAAEAEASRSAEAAVMEDLGRLEHLLSPYLAFNTGRALSFKSLPLVRRRFRSQKNSVK